MAANINSRRNLSGEEKRRFAAAVVVASLLKARKDKGRSKRSCWKRSWIEKRAQFSQFSNILPELRDKDAHSYRRYMRMTHDQFVNILRLVSPMIQKKNTHFREALPADVKLAITLRFLATGDAFRDLQFAFSVPHNSISGFIPEVCDAIYQCLKEHHLKVPNSPAEWNSIADNFHSRWNFPQCIGAMDGKHVLLRCPLKSGSYFYNYKGTFSIVLLALVDAQYKFIYVDVGKNGRVSDGGVFKDSSLDTTLEEGLNLPPTNESHLPYVIVGDKAEKIPHEHRRRSLI
ncbi:hypothetical protein BSL78_09941 [Apostichopus japonicus]|uniref:DDE Tnp4 domain-containing protein n=1 Tax=Stichopus japonicus TaxID=307972 RepID=A0A2G8KYR8_STIJA|nr:hypothetical protein BSL78_09941 [Apostichopus japonicus]